MALALLTHFEWLESLELWKECAAGLLGLAKGLWGNERH